MPRALINVHSFLQDFNPSKFIVYFSTLLFTILFSLRLDNKITFSYWLVFLPLWIWKSISVLGALVGIYIWLRNPEFRISNSSYVHFQSMLISLSLQLLLLMFEILVCDKLETRRHTWTLAFMPLLFISLLSISVCLWSIRNGRGIELEFFAAINILQIVLIALKLDNFLNWSWIVVFIPTWILLCFTVLVISYAMIFAAIVLRSPEVASEQRRASIYSASSSSMVFLPMLVFIIILTNKLDSPGNPMMPGYFSTCLPLFVALLMLIRFSFGSKPGSLWWFGMRSDFCTFLLTICPCIREYGNISYTVNNHHQGDLVGDAIVGQEESSNYSNLYTVSEHPNVLVEADYNQPNATPTETTTSTTTTTTNKRSIKKFLLSVSRVFVRAKSDQTCNDDGSDMITSTNSAIDMPD